MLLLPDPIFAAAQSTLDAAVGHVGRIENFLKTRLAHDSMDQFNDSIATIVFEPSIVLSQLWASGEMLETCDRAFPTFPI